MPGGKISFTQTIRVHVVEKKAQVKRTSDADILSAPVTIAKAVIDYAPSKDLEIYYCV